MLHSPIYMDTRKLRPERKRLARGNQGESKEGKEWIWKGTSRELMFPLTSIPHLIQQDSVSRSTMEPYSYP